MERAATATAVDLYSGCVFFLAGKGNYEDLYKDSKTQKEDKESYDKTKANCCFDYLRLAKEALKYPENIGKGKAFRLEPVFHLNAGKEAREVLEDFKNYCIRGANSPRRLVREFNMQAPKGIPEEFCRIFEAADRPK